MSAASRKRERERVRYLNLATPAWAKEQLDRRYGKDRLAPAAQASARRVTPLGPRLAAMQMMIAMQGLAGMDPGRER